MPTYYIHKFFKSEKVITSFIALTSDFPRSLGKVFILSETKKCQKSFEFFFFLVSMNNKHCLLLSFLRSLILCNLN